MDKLEEVKKLKQLLDDGIIDEIDFKMKKTQILGISSETSKKEEFKEVVEERNKNKSLDDYEKELIEQSEVVEEEKSKTILNNDDYYQQEKLKARAKLEVEEEIRSKRRAEQKTVVDKGVNKAKRILKWILAVFLWIFGIGAICTAIESGIVYVPLGILTLILGGMACPKITDKTQEYPTYTVHKTAIVWIIVIIWMIFSMVGGLNIASQTNLENLNQTSINSETNK